jgi:hypothetical protein
MPDSWYRFLNVGMANSTVPCAGSSLAIANTRRATKAANGAWRAATPEDQSVQMILAYDGDDNDDNAR